MDALIDQKKPPPSRRISLNPRKQRAMEILEDLRSLGNTKKKRSKKKNRNKNMEHHNGVGGGGNKKNRTVGPTTVPLSTTTVPLSSASKKAKQIQRTTAPPQDESTAADKLVTELLNIFKEDSSLVIFVLQQTRSEPIYPTEYYVGGGYYYYSILEILVRAKTSVEKITEFYKICPPEGSDYEARGDDRLDVISALQAACEKTMALKDISLLIFLAKLQENLQKERKKRPLKVRVDDDHRQDYLRDDESSTTHSSRSCTPSAILFRVLNNNKSSIEGIRTLISLWPEALRCPYALGAALDRNDLNEYADSLVACPSSPQWQNGCSVELAVIDCCMGVAQADTLIGMIASGNKERNILTLHVSWEIEGIIHFLKGLQHCGRPIRRINNLACPPLSKLCPEKQHELLDTLFQALSIQSNMSIYGLHVKEGDLAVAPPLINGLEHCLTGNQARELSLIYDIPAFHCQIDYKCYYKKSSHSVWSRICLRADISNPGCAGLLRALAAIPTIKSISVWLTYSRKSKGDLEVSIEELAKMLRASRTLQNLYVIKTWVHCNLTPIYEALKENSNLVVFSWDFMQPQSPIAGEIDCCVDMLKNHNAILTECPTRGDPKIAYYLDLNRLGRNIARTAQNHQLVHLLLAAAQDTRNGSVNHRLGMLYGLLRESPGLWSTSLGTSPRAGYGCGKHN